jgi:hypothetical protein
MNNLELFVNAKIPSIGMKKVWVQVSYEKGRGYWCYTYLPGWRFKLYVKTDEIIRMRNSDANARWLLAKIIKDCRLVKNRSDHYDRTYLMTEYKTLKRYEFIIRKRMNEIS